MKTENQKKSEVKIKGGFTPLESPAIYGRDDIYKVSIPCPVKKYFSNGAYGKDGVKGSSFLTGFTLIETLVTVGIFVFALGAVSTFILELYRSQNFGFNQANAINEARKGIETMVKEIREAKTGEDGSYFIAKADDYEFVFYGDIDKDGAIEKVRYFRGGSVIRTNTKSCVSFSSGGACSVSFSNFLNGILDLAQVKISAEGDLGSSNEYADISADGNYLGRVCQSNCDDCAGLWQGTTLYNVTSDAADNSVQFTADASPAVGAFCDWQEQNHSLKANFELSWTETLPSGQYDFKKGVTEPVGFPAQYPPENEIVAVLSSYVRNTAPIFKYFNKNGQEISEYPARPEDTTLMRVSLVIDVDPNRSPQNFILESDVQLRNLKTNL